MPNKMSLQTEKNLHLKQLTLKNLIKLAKAKQKQLNITHLVSDIEEVL